MSKKRKNNTGNHRGVTKQNNTYAWAGFTLGSKPFLLEDINTEPTKKELDNTAYEYVPFDTFDLFRLDRLQAITNNSPTNGAIITQKVSYTLGDGFYAVPASQFEILKSVREKRSASIDISTLDLDSLNDFLKEMNPEGENVEELCEKIVRDFCTFGNAFIECVKVSVGGVKKFYTRLLPITWCRPKKAEKDEMYSKIVGVTSEFEEGYLVTPKKPLNYQLFPHFGPVTEEDKENNTERCIIHLKNYEPNMTYWGQPDWKDAKIWAEIEYRIAKYNQSKFENGFTPSAIISLYGSTDEREATELVNAMKSCFTGTGNNSKMFIQALRNNEYKADVQTLNNQYEGEFLDMSKTAQENIISGHRWTSALTGLRIAGSLGSNQQIRSEFDIVYNGVIRPIQRKLLTRVLNPIIMEAGEFLGKQWDNIALEIAKPMPVSFLGDISVENALTDDEIRAELGKEPREKQADNGELD